jgi:D-aspartate ligase
LDEFEVPAVVLGGGGVYSLGAIRSLGRAGVNVCYVDDNGSMAFYSKYCNGAIYSKYCKRYFIFPQIGNSRDELRKALFEIKKVIGAAVLFPVSDKFATHLADLTGQLNSHFSTVPKREIIETVINKRKFYESLTWQDIPHPTTFFPENVEDAKKLGARLHYPVFLKPYLSQQFADRFHGKKGYVADKEGELLRLFGSMKRMGVDVMVQEIVEGPPTHHIFLDGYIDGQLDPKVVFARQRLRMWPLDFGNSTLCVSIPVSKVSVLKETLFKYLRAIRYHGIFSAEFKKDSRDSVFKLLEINSRTSGWFNTFSARCGINIMVAAYLDAIGRHVEYSEDYETNIKWIMLMYDCISASRMLRNGDIGIRQWISSLSGKKEFMSYSNDDLKPYVMDLAISLARALAAMWSSS